MVDKSSQVNLEEGYDRFYNYLSESAIFIAIVTASLYFIGFGYYNQFFQRLTVPNRFLNIQIIDYIQVSLVPILIIVLIFLIISRIWTHDPRTRIVAFIGNFLVFIPCVILLISVNLFATDYITKLFITIFLSSIILLYIYRSFKTDSYACYLYKSRRDQIIYLISLIIILNLSASIIGYSTAENLIQGKSGSLEIQLILKDNVDIQLQNKTLIFIMLNDNKYYVIEKNESNTKYPGLYIVQADQVKMAKLHEVE